jgi:hypothetical protein
MGGADQEWEGVTSTSFRFLAWEHGAGGSRSYDGEDQLKPVLTPNYLRTGEVGS